jgi:peptidyl-dipeptidase A
VRRHQGVSPPEGRSAPDWAAKIHIAVSPVYYHTYLYGSIVALQLNEALEAQVGTVVDNPAVGSFLRERYFGRGESIRWDGLVADATGTPFAVGALQRELSRIAA